MQYLNWTYLSYCRQGKLMYNPPKTTLQVLFDFQIRSPNSSTLGCSESGSQYWHYNRSQDACVPDPALSCPSKLHFKTKNSCERLCVASSGLLRPKFSPPLHGGTVMTFELQDCLLSSKTGDCKGRLLRFFYDPTQRECLEFTYSGLIILDYNIR